MSRLYAPGLMEEGSPRTTVTTPLPPTASLAQPIREWKLEHCEQCDHFGGDESDMPCSLLPEGTYCVKTDRERTPREEWLYLTNTGRHPRKHCPWNTGRPTFREWALARTAAPQENR